MVSGMGDMDEGGMGEVGHMEGVADVDGDVGREYAICMGGSTTITLTHYDDFDLCLIA